MMFLTFLSGLRFCWTAWATMSQLTSTAALETPSIASIRRVSSSTSRSRYPAAG